MLSYHSLEDRRVKRLLRSGSAGDEGVTSAGPWVPLLKKALVATPAEVARNSRARSAKLRAGEKANPDAQAGGDASSREGPIVGAKQRAKMARRLAEEQANDNRDL